MRFHGSNMLLNNTKGTHLRFHCNSGYPKALQSYLILMLPVLFLYGINLPCSSTDSSSVQSGMCSCRMAHHRPV
jgi:hypothetical protein